jgi:hypothetical protein
MASLRRAEAHHNHRLRLLAASATGVITLSMSFASFNNIMAVTNFLSGLGMLL